MSIFKSILARIFPSSHPANTEASSSQPASTGEAATTSAAPAATPSTAMPEVDVRAVLVEMQSGNPQKLNWDTSIVDLMKLLGLDSSLAARKSLASELGYSGDTEDSASMNIWLHKQVMIKLAENGGKVPDELKH
ncbi:DUF3597 domain-containing protein [Bordetella genomosp. 11]|uniref:DUF3597 domain-containing protein n=1 Tax=Bordetella genomosp. 11 TaxID=1416808 RepID=A0A261UHB7_9BORD|nr:DUF3597 domain-containing protein [Bordetella genomosp. 11]OZI61326.1 hypothetical protein CAL28_18590 [Bordetella genomosp. 11]